MEGRIWQRSDINHGKFNIDAECSQLNIGAIWNTELVSSAGVGDVAGAASTSLYTGLNAAASGLKDVVRCRNAEAGRSMMLMSLSRCR